MQLERIVERMIRLYLPDIKVTSFLQSQTILVIMTTLCFLAFNQLYFLFYLPAKR